MGWHEQLEVDAGRIRFGQWVKHRTGNWMDRVCGFASDGRLELRNRPGFVFDAVYFDPCEGPN